MRGKKLTSGNTGKKESTSKNSVKVHVKALYGFPDEAGRAGAAGESPKFLASLDPATPLALPSLAACSLQLLDPSAAAVVHSIS